MARFLILAATCLVLGLAMSARAEDVKQEDIDPSLPIYKLVRSLEDVQDKIVSGDLKAVEMQRFMIGMIDRRLRTAGPDEFNDLRNVDAAMIYAMSGGNPATLDTLIAHDARGNFDTRLTNALLMYLGGKGGSANKTLDEIVPEYKSTSIGPYLALVAANVVMQTKPDLALKYFDWARLSLPGTIVEEAALRRSLIITVKQNNIESSIRFARLYLSRFPTSPYAAQVADQVVTLIDAHYDKIGNDRISQTLAWLDGPRQQEIYLRIARKAAVTGRFEFAHWAAGNALALSAGKDDNPAKLAQLYLNLSSVPDADIAEVKSAFAKIPDEILGPDERRLRDAGAFVLSEVERPATLESLTQAPSVKPKSENETAGKPSHPEGGKAPPPKEAKPPVGQPAEAKPSGAQPPQKQNAANLAPAKPGEAKAQPASDAKDGIDTFLSDSQAQLKAIDDLMKKGDK
ncbi:MAG TPA: chemotaxis protein [Ensifer sp.]|nr:chemotaxis protein [Ensifer sp.]